MIRQTERFCKGKGESAKSFHNSSSLTDCFQSSDPEHDLKWLFLQFVNYSINAIRFCIMPLWVILTVEISTCCRLNGDLFCTKATRVQLKVELKSFT